MTTSTTGPTPLPQQDAALQYFMKQAHSLNSHNSKIVKE